MDYKKLYEEALMRADEAVQKGCLDKATFNEIFPPEESEDERIRKEIKDIVLSYRSNCVYEGNHHFDECLAWLEKKKEPENTSASTMIPSCWETKQKEQKPHRVAVDTCEAIDKVREFDEQMEKEQKPTVPVDDEMVFKTLHWLVWNHTWMNGATREECDAWLKRQKVPKLATEDLQKSFEAGQKSIMDNPEQYGLCKPAEWSEDDEK